MLKNVLNNTKVKLDCAECPNKLYCVTNKRKPAFLSLEMYTELINSGKSPHELCLKTKHTRGADSTIVRIEAK